MFEMSADDHGVLLRRDAIASGIDDNALRRGVHQGRIVRIRQGAYVLRHVWDALDETAKYRTLTVAVLKLYRDAATPFALSHATANVEQGGPTWGLDLTDVHLTSLEGIGERSGAKVVHHRGVCRVNDVTRMGGHWITSPARTAMDTASLAGRDAGVAVLDNFQQRGLATREELEVVLTSMKSWPDSLGLIRMLQLSDGKAESVGETRQRLLIKDQRLPAPVPQFEVFHPSGRLAARIDFAWPERRVLLEFDGRAKYLRFRRPGETIEQAVMREKAREDLIRELTGFILVRTVWADLYRPEATAARILRAFAQAA
jgi:hypothetical protein